jgi:hypothetical protein
MRDLREARSQAHERVLHDVLRGGVVVRQQPRQPHRARIRIPIEGREVVVHPSTDPASHGHETGFHASLDAAVCRSVALSTQEVLCHGTQRRGV